MLVKGITGNSRDCRNWELSVFCKDRRKHGNTHVLHLNGKRMDTFLYKRTLPCPARFPSTSSTSISIPTFSHDDVIKWKHFSRYWPFVWGIHRSPMNSPDKSRWRGALMFSSIWTNGWVNNRDVGDLRRHRAHYDVIVIPMASLFHTVSIPSSIDSNFTFP